MNIAPAPAKQNIQVQVIVSFLLALTLLAVPISATVKSISISLAAGLMVFISDYRKDLLSVISKPWCQAIILFFAVAVIACAWSPNSMDEKLGMLKQFSKLLFFPFLVVGFRDPIARRYGIHAFLLAMLVTCFLSILKAKGLFDYNGPDPGQIFHNHIMTGFMMAFATYLSALLSIQVKGKWRLFYISLTLLFSYQILFVSTGRTGYVVYLLLMMLLAVQNLSWKKALIAIIVICSLFIISYNKSQPMQFVIRQGIDNIRDYQQGNKNTAIGHRLQFHLFAKDLFLRHPWLGNGTGSYTYLFKKEEPDPDWIAIAFTPKKLFEPHSLYWLFAAEYGIVGLAILLFFFGSLFVTSLQLQSMRTIAMALLLPFIIGNLSDSLLFYSGIGYFFLMFMAMCLGEQHETAEPRCS